jgi:pSer/pThr/pTyr-binding forkhead associated (FHA) protein
MARIEVRFNNVAVREVPLDRPTITIGRSGKNDIVVDNMAVSRKHARIYQEGPRFIVEDLKSLNGTFVNNKKVSQWILSDNDKIHIGKHTLVFIDEDVQPSAEPSRRGQDVAEHTLVLDTKKQRELLAKTPEASKEGEPQEIRGGIVIISGGVGQEDIELARRLSVAGKGDHADIKLKGLFVGKTAFFISQRPSGFFISRSGGRTTPRVNGVPIKDQQELKDGDVISAGRTKMQFYTRD